MKFAIDARGASWYNGTGIGTYTQNLVKELLNIDPNNEYYLYWSGDGYDNYTQDNSNIIMTSKKHRRFFQNSYFPKHISSNDISLFHVPQNGIGMDIDVECAKVATIHDLIPYVLPETAGRGYQTKFLREVPQIINNCDGLLTVSEYSKQDILKFFPIDPDKIFVTPLSANSDFIPLDKEECKHYLKEKFNITNDFLLYLGGFSVRKNVDSLIRAFAKTYKNFDKECNLVILGSYRDESRSLIKLIESLGITDKVIFPGFIENEDLVYFYNACTSFVYPSYYEGFGLPPLEAMHCGAPVITSNTTSIPEVVGDAGLLIDPGNLNQLADAIGTMVSNESLQQEFAKKGLERAALFSWENTARKTLEAYSQIIGNYIVSNL